jgi:diguanylate cyclase (GGDEF)-like protein
VGESQAPRSGSLAALGQRPPRLVLRVILYSALTLGIGAATLLVFIRHFERTRAEHTAMLQSSVVTQSVVDRLQSSDLTGSVSAGRRRELDRLFKARVLDAETLAASIVTARGGVVYSTNDLGRSRPVNREELSGALTGTVASEVVSLASGSSSKRVLRTYAPFRLTNGAKGAVVVDKDYAAIASAARRAAITVAAVLEAVLIALWLCLIPVMRTVTRRIHRQLDTIAHMALHDDLTGLPNRTQLEAQLEQLLDRARTQKPFAVFFIDLDRFKEVNDTLGHDRGNDLLMEISKRLKATLQPGELVARLGGDEFAVVSERALDDDAALALANRLRDEIAEMFDLAGISIEPQASIGVAFAPRHGTTRDELLRCADIAMYAAKRSGAAQVFTPEMDDHSPVRLALTGELRRALERRELVVYYQPQVDLRRGDVRSAEALVRWNHPTRGLLEPGAFLDAIDHSGLTRRLTRYVLEESLHQLRLWREAGYELRLAVNVSPRDLADARFPEELAQALDEYGIEPSALEVEITEDVLLLDSVRTGKRLEKIVERGVRIAIDDFGVGYSSLGQLKNLPAQVLKIDQSFIAGMASDRRDVAIVRSTIALAHDLGLEVVAEGVETGEHLTELLAAGCDVGQGFHFGRPVPLGTPLDVFVKIPETPRTVSRSRDGADVIPMRRRSA